MFLLRQSAFLLHLAYRNLIARKSSLVFMVVAVAFGLAFQWPNIANISGYSRELISKFVEQGFGHYRITHNQHEFFNPGPVRKAVKKNPRVQAVHPRIRLHGLIVRVHGRSANLGVEVLGVSTGEWRRMFGKRSPDRKKNPDFLVGRRIAEKLKLNRTEHARLLLPFRGRARIVKIERFAIPRYGYPAEKQIVFPLERLQTVLGLGRKVSEVSVLSFRRFEESRPELAPGTALDRDFVITPWWRADEFIAGVVRGNKTLAVISSFMVLVGISLPIVALLYIGVLRDRRGIALLTGFGFRRSQIFVIYFLRGLILAVLGCALGTVLGFALLSYFENYPIYQSASFTIQPSWRFEDLLTSMAVVSLATLLGGLYPAYRAAQVNPVIIFRDE